MNLGTKITLQQAKSIRGGGGVGFWTIAVGITMISSVLMSAANTVIDTIHTNENPTADESSSGSLSSTSNMRIRLSKYPSRTFVTFNTPF